MLNIRLMIGKQKWPVTGRSEGMGGNEIGGRDSNRREVRVRGGGEQDQQNKNSQTKC